MNFEITQAPKIFNPDTMRPEHKTLITLKPEIIRINGPENFVGNFSEEKLTEDDFNEIIKQLREVLLGEKSSNI